MSEKKKETKSTKKVEKAKFCGECGAKLKEKDKFCMECGAPISAPAKKESKKEEEKSEVKEEKKVEVQQPKKSNKGLIITLIVLACVFSFAIIAVILLLVLGVFAKKPETSWGKLYADKLQEMVDYHQKYPKAEMYGVIQGVSNYKIRIVDIGEKYPIMISEAKKEDKIQRIIYYIKDDNKVESLTGVTNDKVKLLYNTEIKDYVWYYESINDMTASYMPLGKMIRADKSMDNSNSKCYNCTTENPEQKVDKYTDYTFYIKEATSDTNIEKYISYKDQTFIEVEKEVAEQTINIDKPNTVNKSVANLEGTYQETKDLITNKDKKTVEKQEKEIEEKLEEYNKKQEELALTSSNFQQKVGEHLKWFSAAYLGPYYGLDSVYKYVDVTGKVSVPGTIAEFMTYEVQGASSIASIKENMLKYMDQSVFDNLNRRQYKGLFGEMHDYNGKVYLVRGGIGEGPYIKPENARFISYENGIAKIALDEYDGLSGMKDSTITVTIQYREGKYIITSFN